MMLVGAVVLGGLKRIARVASWLVPIMALAYILMSLLVILVSAYTLVVMPAQKVLSYRQTLLRQPGHNFKRLLKCTLADGDHGFLQFGGILIHCHGKLSIWSRSITAASNGVSLRSVR